MLFQRTIFVDKNTIWGQWWHLFSEVMELATAIIRFQIAARLPEKILGDNELDRLLNLAANEAVDCQASSDTLLHILQEKYGADSYGAYSRVNINNTKRGYYGEVNHDER